ncbi:hypothetical protein JCM19232_2677 [Vibrio ishigakensis]|uniref:DUF2987 domain-containing protein n=1 Tax=Vibrio ishigakensis TaxID=1481914 RepID=A0A0B8PGE4_9VIBR|nr:hypothetical protein JCM19232_2677 [Vibrio ishigakensis]
MKKMLVAAGIAALCATSVAHAEEYMFTYSKLYSPLKHNLKQPDSDVKVGLFFTNFATKQPCSIKKAWMEKEEHYEELKIADNGEVNVPLDSNLRSANPLVYIVTQGEARCDYSLVVLSKESWQGNIDKQTLETSTEQMHDMLGNLGGMFSSWFTPDISGVTLEFKPGSIQNISLSNGKLIDVDEYGKAILMLSDLSDGVTANLSQPTQRVMPYIQK